MKKLDKPEDILELLENVERTGQDNQYKATCPAHDDSDPSLSIRIKSDKVLVNCHAGCPPEAVVDALGLDMSDLSFNGHEDIDKKHSPDIVETYDYKDENGNLLFQVCRKSNKDFLFRRKVGEDWEWSIRDNNGFAVKPVLYHLPEVLEASDHGERIYLVEGEKDADNLREHNLVATCNPMGAGSWKNLHTTQLEEARVIVIPDADKEGIEHANEVANDLFSVAASLKLIEPEKLGFEVKEDSGKDISDWLEDENTKEELVDRVEQANKWEATAKQSNRRFKQFNEVNDQTPNKGGRKAEFIELVKDIEPQEIQGTPEFPKQAVDKGVIGRYVNWLDENSEEPPSFAFAAYRNILGLAIGREYRVKYGGATHAPVFFDVLIGRSSLSRKSNM